MAMIKCASCGKTVSDSNKLCPYCGGKTDNSVCCPKCNSTNTSLNIKSAGLVQTSIVYSLFGVVAGKAAEKEKIRYVCKDCGKKFKLK